MESLDYFAGNTRKVESLGNHGRSQGCFASYYICFTGGEQVDLVLISEMLSKCILVFTQNNDIFYMMKRRKPSHILREPLPQCLFVEGLQLFLGNKLHSGGNAIHNLSFFHNLNISPVITHPDTKEVHFRPGCLPLSQTREQRGNRAYIVGCSQG